MKKLLLVVSLVVATASALAQGTIYFNNYVRGVVDAPVFDVDGTTRLQGTGYSAQLEINGTAVGPVLNFRTAASNVAPAGLVAGAASFAVAGIAPGTQVSVRMHAWMGALGTGPEGYSNPFSVALGGVSVGGAPPTPAVNLIGLTSFSLVPEPSTIALGLLGAAALLLRRRN